MPLRAIGQWIRKRRGGGQAPAETRIERETRIIRESGLFDDAFYARQSPELKDGTVSLIAHYLRKGASRGRNPSRSFDTGFYLDRIPSVARRHANPLVHYINSGRKRGLKPTADVDDWDALEVPTVTTTAGSSGARRIFVVPAYLSERNTTRYRVHHLVELLGSESVTVVDYHDPPDGFFGQLDQNAIVILQRLPLSSHTEPFLNRVRQSPALVVFDIDDQVFDPNEMEDWRLDALDQLPSRYARCMAMADQFLVSTKRLRDKVERRFRKPAHVVTNLLSAEIMALSEASRHQTARPERFVIGYASGSATHDRDLATVLPALEQFLRDNPAAEFHCIGYLELPEALCEAFGERVVCRPPVHWRDLPAELARFSVQIIPLLDCAFNRYKSHIRFLESAAVGVPVLVPAVSELAATVIEGETGLICGDDPEAWREALQRLHDDPELRARIADNARGFVGRYFTTASPFARARLRRAMDDLELGACRDKISVIVNTYNPPAEVRATIDGILATIGVPFELLIWNNSSDPETRAYLDDIAHDGVMVVEVGRNVGKARASNYLFGVAVERFICGFDDDYVPPRQWDLRMIHAAKAIPNLGWLSTNLTADSSGIRDRGEVDAFPGGVSVLRAAGVGGWVMFTTASARQKIGLYREHGLYGGIDGDYNRRARRSGLYTGYVRGVVGTHKHGRMKNAAWELFKQRIQDAMRVHGKDSDNVTDKFVDFFGARPTELCVAIKICTSVTHDENVWGDTHYAYGLMSALEKLGYVVRVDKHEDWYEANRETTDVVIHLFGLHKYKPDERHLNVLWIISHADLIDADFLYGFDYIFAASDTITERVRALAPEIRVETLLQCTDTTVFFPDAAIDRDIDVAFVGNSRRVYREAVKYAVEQGFEVAVWGTRWEPFISARYIKGQSLTGPEVADVYRRARVVLNDHWADQKADGLVNNRVFDVLACDTAVLSDDNAGLVALFGDRVPTFSDRETFSASLAQLLADPNREAHASALGAEVRAEHTFDQRAAAIHAAIRYLIEDYVAYKSERLWALRQERAVALAVPADVTPVSSSAAGAATPSRRRRRSRNRRAT